VGEIRDKWISQEVKVEILEVIDNAKDGGIPITRTCTLLMIDRRRVTRWRLKRDNGSSLDNMKPGPIEAVNRLLPVERESVLIMAMKEEYADMSHRVLTVTAWDLDIFHVSFSSVYRILRAKNLIPMRGVQRHHNGRSIPPVCKALTGPNQRWCWDISYLPTMEKGIFLYLYLLLDEYSRKAISWLISRRQTAKEAKELIEEGLINENILDLPEDERPEVINDRGRQRMFDDNHMPQMFARPRTPNDNPYIESMFSIIKRDHQYPGGYLDRDEAVQYFREYFNWYNYEHLHSGIDFVTPDQCHNGLRDKIVSLRKDKIKK
jgi:transposase InsO family protein